MAFDRAEALSRLASEEFDVLVVGGGITGAGCALDAAARGLRAALVERDDWSTGTSSRSSKLVHGGLRYLQQGEIRLVYEALAERQVLRKTAPHLVRIMPFLLPIFGKEGLINKKLARALGTAMWLYDLTGGIRIGKLHKRVGKEEALRQMPTLPPDRLASAYVYYDAQADDARLTLAVVRTAAAFGAAAANYAAVTAVRKEHGRACGAVITADGREIEVRARAVVNATGVWADEVRLLDEGTNPASIRPAKGIHITVPWAKVRNQVAAIVPVPKDKRSIFVVPWGDTGNGEFEFTYVGTTDTDYDGPLEDPQCTPEDIDYLLRALEFSVTTGITADDVLGAWAGLRPLVREGGSARTTDLSRRHSIRTSPSGMITITGGKLTTYRRMAIDTIDEVLKARGERRPRSTTKHIALVGADGWDRAGLGDHLAGRYGNEGRAVRALVGADPALAAPLVPGLPYSRAEAVFAVREEMARTLDDVLSRRTRARLLARDASAAAAEDVAALIAPDLGWSDEQCRAEVDSYRASVEAERSAAHLPETALDAALGA